MVDRHLKAELLVFSGGGIGLGQREHAADEDAAAARSGRPGAERWVVLAKSGTVALRSRSPAAPAPMPAFIRLRRDTDFWDMTYSLGV
jgi:hypothetical protein